MPNLRIREQFEKDGWALVSDRLPANVLDSLRSNTTNLLGDRAGTRSILDTQWGLSFVQSTEVQETLRLLDASGMFCVRAVLFDKHAGANWKVPWHQDRKIAVTDRREIEGFRGWSVKEGVVHCQPTAEVLASMLTLRFHLDDCGLDNGPLKVLPGTHVDGFLTINATERILNFIQPESCTCAAGDVVALKPLLLHASSQAKIVAHRRVLHLEFAGTALPNGLDWFWKVA